MRSLLGCNVGLRFFRRLRLVPGLRLNLSRSGVSTSVGGRGAWLTFGKRGTRATVGLPGTGLSYTATANRAQGEPTPDPGRAPRRGAGGLILLLVLLAIWALVAWHAIG